MDNKKYSIAVIGSGVAGLTAAYILSKKHSVTLFEKNDYIGGHTHTIVIPDGPDKGTPVDTGFIVMNHRNYPLLTKLFNELKISLRDSDMSFGYYHETSGLQYSSKGVKGLFAQRSNIIKPSYLRMVMDLFRFYKMGKNDLDRGITAELTLGEYLNNNNFSEIFINHHLIPMGAAIWSTPNDKMMEFPAISFLRFLNNHGLLSVTGQPQWKTVVGGSHQYVKVIKKSLNTIYTESPVTRVIRSENGITVVTESGKSFAFDRVIIATHADEALSILDNPTSAEKLLLGPWRYEKNITVLHTDESVMPPNRRAHASWNFTSETTAENRSVLSLTYDMNHLQGLKTQKRYYVSLNRFRPIPKDKIVAEMIYDHPTFTFESMKTQQELPSLNGKLNTWFCGSYYGYGFHEDAVCSAVAVAKEFGIEL